MGTLSHAQNACEISIGCTRLIKGDSICWKHGGKGEIISNQCIDYTNAENKRCTIISYHETELCRFHRWVYYTEKDSIKSPRWWRGRKINTNKVR